MSNDNGRGDNAPHQPHDNPQFATIETYLDAQQTARAIGMLIHNVYAVCEGHSAVVRHGNGTPKDGNPRQYWLEIGGQTKGQYSGGKTVARFKAHTTLEIIDKATKALTKYLDAAQTGGAS